MKYVMVFWNKFSASDFEEKIPLNFIAQRYRSRNFTASFDLLFLEGIEKLSQNYLQTLHQNNFLTHDVSKMYDSFSKAYSSLDRFGDYEKKCFLRWMVLKEYFRGEKIIHFDGDLILNEDPATLLKKINNRTFVLQGCPAFTVISDPHWFDCYEENLNIFCKNIDAYSKKAWQERDGWRESETLKWAGQRNRPVITSDQDLISHLIHTGRIIQDNPKNIMSDLNEYILFENPLFINQYTPWNRDLPYQYKKDGYDEKIDGKNVLFWHMQNDFVNYLNNFLIFKNYLKFFHTRLPNNLIYKDILIPESIGHRPVSTVLKFFTKDFIFNQTFRLLKKRLSNYNRLEIYKYFLEEKDFSEILNEKIWWKKGCFTSSKFNIPSHSKD
ncbi:MAG: hypothetical protein HYV97_15660 [Bdellovibrio sp.]|nr:hypothetical protein [Bdellovibrio sp.]